MSSVTEICWFVAHVRPRREKKLVEFCIRQSIAATLPCYDSAHKYRGKTVVFRKPLFPGYVFLQLKSEQRATIRQNEHVAKLLEVHDQETFQTQLDNILTALESKLGVHLAPSISQGMRVRIRNGPLQGIEGLIETRQGMSTVLLRLDFINQAAAVKIDAPTWSSFDQHPENPFHHHRVNPKAIASPTNSPTRGISPCSFFASRTSHRPL